MSLYKGAKKEDLRLIAREINQTVEDKMTILDLSNLIAESDIYKTKPEFVNEVAESIINERKRADQEQLELEKLKLERSKTELELEKIRSNSKHLGGNEEEKLSLDSLVKSIRTLTVKPPSSPDGWAFFFKSLERAFAAKVVPDQFRAEILLNLMGERASNVITYIKDEELKDYEKLKAIIIREFEPTAQACLDNFKRACKLPQETYTQLVSRLTTSWEYYLKLRKVNDFKSLNELIISDKLFSILDKETAAHISVRQADGFFDPVSMAREVELYFTSRGKSIVDDSKNIRKNSYVKNNPKVFLSDVKEVKCHFCSENHVLSKCPRYLNLSVKERNEFVKSSRLCFLCLNKHMIKNCESRAFCFCKKKHHKTLHFSGGRNQEEREREQSRHLDDSSDQLNAGAAEFRPQSANALISHSVREDTILLSTVNCYLLGADGRDFKCKAVLDSGSEKHFISKRLADVLNLRQQGINMKVTGLNNASLSVNSRLKTRMSNKDKTYMRELEFLVVSKIMSDVTPRQKLSLDIQEFQNFNLADEQFWIPQRPDLILGVEIFFELMRPGQFRLNNSNLILQNTVFGFTISGSTEGESKPTIYCGLAQEEVDLDRTLKNFWEIEQISNETPQGREATICEEHFKNNVKRDEGGRYSVQMPFKEDPSGLGESRRKALRCLNSMWMRMAREPQLLYLYKAFIEEYEAMNHMEKVEETEEPETCYYLPHHAVFRPESTSTPLRVVFNASSLTSSGKSLNCLQYKGEVIQNDLFTIILNFRKNKIAFVADIKKMYRMILIDQCQRDLLRILWKSAEDGEVKTYRLRTVTYGTTSAPYLATRTLKELSHDEGHKFPLAAPILVDSCYMDDILSGAQSLDEAKELQLQLIELLKSGGMSLHKWRSNHPELIKNEQTAYDFTNPEETLTLGVCWQHKEDVFSFKVNSADLTQITKRSVLSVIARLFDPLGFLGPIITKAKVFMQRLWLLDLNWSDQLPEREIKEWRKFAVSLQSITEIKVERCILMPSAIHIELHGFCDASETAYGAVIYCKSKSNSGEVSIQLVTSKSRVAPIKKLTTPRLELSAAVLLAKLINRVVSALKLDASCVLLWSDSMIVLSWLQKEPFKLKTFVSNRVAVIQELTDIQQWRFVSTKENPADLISRGVDPDKLLQSELWWKGPLFLTADVYPEREIPIAVTESDFCNELKNCDSNFCMLNLQVKTFTDSLLNLTNDYAKLIRILSYIFRFTKNCRGAKKFGPLSVSETKEAETFLIKAIQLNEFAQEVKDLKREGKINPKSQVKNLFPFLDKNGIMRAGGRLANSGLAYDRKYPVILPKNHRLTILIIEMIHKKYLHIGPQALLFQVRQRFWPINGRNMCRKIFHQCIVCFKAKPITEEQLMGNLPKERVTQSFPFNCVGVDFCGPFQIKYPNQRKGQLSKVYISIFICLVTKACHLELVSALTSAAFIATLKRFVNRRGKCAHIFSDNAKNFVGSNLELKRLANLVCRPDETLGSFLCNEGIDWSFIPPRAPNHGGLWEAGVKSVKFHLKRVVGNYKLTYEEFLTVLVQVEGILNSRPLYPLSAELDEFEVLTPGHFLVGRPITAIAEPSVLHVADNRLTAWQKLTKIIQVIWKNWSNNYMSTLQQRNKWRFEKNNVCIGDVVLLAEENLPTCKWVVGRIIDVNPGNDGKIRVVKVKTQFGVFKRGISKIAILPLPN